VLLSCVKLVFSLPSLPVNGVRYQLALVFRLTVFVLATTVRVA
jgi:hypothetical protein